LSRRSGKKAGTFARVVRRYLWRGDPAAKAAAVTQFVVAVLAVAAATLGVTGVAFISSTFFRAVALVVGSVILLAQLVAGEQWHKQANVLANLRRNVHSDLPDRIESIVTTNLAAASKAAVREVAPARIETELREILSTSSGWMFQGGSGRWLRSATLPHLARARNTDVNITALLLDPRDEELCVQWVQSHFSRRYNEGPSSPMVPRMIQTNVLATIYSLGWYGACSRIKPKIVLLSTFSSQRYDVGSTGLVITVATRNEPAIYARNGSWFYETVCSDLLKACERNPSVNLPQEDSREPLIYPVLDDVQGPTVAAALQQMTIDDGSGASHPLLDRYSSPAELDFDSIAREVRQPG